MRVPRGKSSPSFSGGCCLTSLRCAIDRAHQHQHRHRHQHRFQLQLRHQLLNQRASTRNGCGRCCASSGRSWWTCSHRHSRRRRHSRCWTRASCCGMCRRSSTLRCVPAHLCVAVAAGVPELTCTSLCGVAVPCCAGCSSLNASSDGPPPHPLHPPTPRSYPRAGCDGSRAWHCSSPWRRWW